MRIESSRMRVESTRSMEWLQVLSIDSTCMRVIVFFKWPQACVCSFGLHSVACQNYTHECETHTQRAKSIRIGMKISDITAS
jgi:hypothetical protein